MDGLRVGKRLVTCLENFVLMFPNKKFYVHNINKGGFFEIMKTGKLIGSDGVPGWGGMTKVRAVRLEDAIKNGDGRYPRLFSDTDITDECIVFVTDEVGNETNAQVSWYQEELEFEMAIGLGKNGTFTTFGFFLPKIASTKD